MDRRPTGRVERANQTLQDRLIKEMRLRNIRSMAAARVFLPSFILNWNEKFAVEPSDKVPAHRPWTKTEDELDLLFARQEERVLSKALTFSYDGTKYCVKTSGPGTAMRGAKVMVHHFTDGRLRVTYKERVLALTACGTYLVPDARMDAIVAVARAATSAFEWALRVARVPPMDYRHEHSPEEGQSCTLPDRTTSPKQGHSSAIPNAVDFVVFSLSGSLSRVGLGAGLRLPTVRAGVSRRPRWSGVNGPSPEARHIR